MTRAQRAARAVGRHLPESWGANLHLLTHAMLRVAHEFDDLSALQRGEVQVFDALFYIAELGAADRERFADALAVVMHTDRGRPVLPAAVRRGVVPVMFRVQAPSAESAAITCMAWMRDALKVMGRECERLRVQVEPADGELPWGND